MNIKGIVVIVVLLGYLGYIHGNDEEIAKSSDFTFQFYKEAYDKNINMVMCPISIRFVLAFLYQNTLTNSATENELINKLRFDTKNETLRVHNEIFWRYKIEEQLYFSNSIWINSISRKEMTVNFVRNSRAYNTYINNTDFERLTHAVTQINNWVDDKTKGKVTEIVKNSDVEDKNAILCSTVYFKGLWDKKFNEDYVESREFTNSNGHKLNVDMMTESSNNFYADIDELGAEVVELAYEENDFTFWIILPHTDSDITAVKDKLSTDMIKKINRKLEYTSMELWLPKFDIATEIDVKETLNCLGISKIFENAELSMFGDHNLKIDSMMQKIKMRVDLNGSVLAAGMDVVGDDVDSNISLTKIAVALYETEPAAGVDVIDAGMDDVVFDCNRPFIFMVMRARTPIFIGHIANPK